VNIDRISSKLGECEKKLKGFALAFDKFIKNGAFWTRKSRYISGRDAPMELYQPNLKLTIDQVSRITGVKKVTLRYWEKSFGEFLQPGRTNSQRREYSMTDLEIIDNIKKLLEDEHLTNQGVRLRLGERNVRG
jgi:hypothetical protein